MFVTNLCGTGSKEMSEDELVSVMAEFDGDDEGEMGQVDILINDKVVVLQFTHYHMTDADCDWIILRTECTEEFIERLNDVYKGTCETS